MITSNQSNLLALDIGDAKIGIAIASYPMYLTKPLITLKNDQNFIDRLKTIISEQNIHTLVVGLPRSLESKSTGQTLKVKSFAQELSNRLSLEVFFQDEFLTSKKAIEILRSHSKQYLKEDVDKLAAALILEDYVKDNVKL